MGGFVLKTRMDLKSIEVPFACILGHCFGYSCPVGIMFAILSAVAACVRSRGLV